LKYVVNFINTWVLLRRWREAREKGGFSRCSMQKIKGLLPSLKERKRYLAIKVEPLDGQQILRNPSEEILLKLKAILGVFDSAEAGIMHVEYDAKERIEVIRVSAKMLDKIRAGLLFINELGTQKVVLKSIKVSGMVNRVKGLKEE
jgi:RNase P/RNase MRP subunit POP5